MLRLAPAAWLAALLGVGGLALAQEGTIVDPWQHAVSTLFKAAPAPAPAHVRHATGVTSFPVENHARASHPAVVPVGPPLRGAPLDPWTAMPIGLTEPGDGIVDPWAPVRARAGVGRGSHAAPSDWAREIREIVDPWAKGPVAVAATDPAIVDPWAR